MKGRRGARVYFLDILITGEICALEESLKGGGVGGPEEATGRGGPGSSLGGAGVGESAGGGCPAVAPVGAAAGGEAVSSPADVKGDPVRVTVPSRVTSRESVRASSWESEGELSSPNASMMEPASSFRDVLQPATVLATTPRSASMLERYSADEECDTGA